MSIANVLKKLNSRDTLIFPTINTVTKIVFIAILAVTATFFIKSILAIESELDTSTAIEKFQEKQDAINKGNNQESWMNESIMSNAMSLNQAMVGSVPKNVLTGQAKFIPGGIIGFTNQSIAYLYNPPVSGVQYVAQTLNNFLGKPVYAQGVTNQGLAGILPIWKSFRNAVYALFSVVFIVIGIAIMLRIKISSQAVVTIQNSVPKIITSLVLVTFSYAIAGLLIDATYLIQALSLSLLFNSSNGINSGLFPGQIINPTFTQLMNAGFWEVNGLITKAVPVGTIALLAGIPSAILTGIIAVSTFGAATAVGFIVGGSTFILIFFIILIMIIVYTVKFFFGMIKCYLAIIIRIILGPLEIALGAASNMKMGFSSWLTNLVANLAVFPISIFFLVLVNMIINVSTKNLWTPPMFAGGWILGPALGIASLMVLSKLPTIIPELVFQIKPSGFGKAIGEGFNDSYLGKGYATYKKGQQERYVSQVASGIGRAEKEITSRTGAVVRESKTYGKLQGAKTATTLKKAEKNGDYQI